MTTTTTTKTTTTTTSRTRAATTAAMTTGITTFLVFIYHHYPKINDHRGGGRIPLVITYFLDIFMRTWGYYPSKGGSTILHHEVKLK